MHNRFTIIVVPSDRKKAVPSTVMTAQSRLKLFRILLAEIFLPV